MANYASGAATQTYTYDASGNRAGYSDNAAPPVSLAYNIDPASNRLASISGTWTGSFTYDPAGNMLSYSTPFSGYSFTYDARNRQTQAYVGAIPTNFMINGLGQRIGQSIKVLNASVPQFFFVYDEASHQTGKYDGGGGPLWETAWLGDLPAAVLAPAGNFYVAPDHLGSPHQITDSSGAVVWLWRPDPFGNGDPLGAFSYELRFPGQYFDQATRLHYNYFRDYDPRTGRYIESDPMGLAGGINTYAYVGGNPVSRVDPLGLTDFSQWIGRIYNYLCPPDNLCPPCKTVSGTEVPVGTIAFRPLDTQPGHGIEGPHFNIYKANQYPAPKCDCFWQPIGAVPPSGLPAGAIPIEPFAN